MPYAFCVVSLGRMCGGCGVCGYLVYVRVVWGVWSAFCVMYVGCGVCMVCMWCVCVVWGVWCGRGSTTGHRPGRWATGSPQCSPGQPRISWQGEGLPTHSLPHLHPSRVTVPEKAHESSNEELPHQGAGRWAQEWLGNLGCRQRNLPPVPCIPFWPH